jgi:hypothetical protein
MVALTEASLSGEAAFGGGEILGGSLVEDRRRGPIGAAARRRGWVVANAAAALVSSSDINRPNADHILSRVAVKGPTVGRVT